MTQKEFIDQLPLLTDNPLPIKPPLVFNSMSARIFPLRASLDILQQVCNGYLNLVPPEVGYFRAAMPYVFLMIIDYGQLEEAVMRIGWFAQLEVFFGVPLEWYKLVNGRWEFHNWAVITPFIFVDDDFSVPMGRTVYGFPKTLAKVVKAESGWIKNPDGPITLARVDTRVLPDQYSGKDIETHVFLEVERNTLSPFQMPFDAVNPLMPWTMASNIAQSLAGFSRDAAWMAQAMRISPGINPGADPSVFPAMLSRALPWLMLNQTGFTQNSLNLKQFRRAEAPDFVCYQGLTNGRLQTIAFNSGGLLGENQLALGDLSGGHSIKLYEYSSLPIVRTLGLEVHRQWRGENANVAELKPVMPFWINVDLEYLEGENLAWRGIDGIWKDGTGAQIQPDQVSQEPEFNNTVATPIDEIAGPFEFSDTTTRVLPLLADRKTLQKFLDGFINEPLKSPIIREGTEYKEEVRFQVWARPAQPVDGGKPIGGDGAFVYLTATSFGDVTSGSNNVGNWIKYETAFMIPVKWQRKAENGLWQDAGVGVIPAFSFVDDCIAAISRLEVQGIQAMTANFMRPESAWLSGDGEPNDPQQTLLRVDAEVVPALSAGQTGIILPVIEISQGDPDEGLGNEPDWPWRWAEHLRKELASKSAAKINCLTELKAGRALALEFLGNQTPFAVYTLKQFRDVAEPVKACYQSIVRLPRALKEVFDVREIEDTLVVRIHDYPTTEIAQTLGIVARRLADGAAGITHWAQAIRPFYIRATVAEPLPERLLSRAGTSTWTLHASAFDTMLSDKPGDDGTPRITVDWRAEKLQDQDDPCKIPAIMSQCRQHRLYWTEAQKNQATEKVIQRNDRLMRESGVPTTLQMGPEITPAVVREALGKVDPQMVIESVLSREWNNYNPNALWRQGREQLIKAFSALPLGGDTKAIAEVELCRTINNLLASRPGSVAGLIPAEGKTPPPELTTPAGLRWAAEVSGIIEREYTFTLERVKLERCVDDLSLVAVLGLTGVQNVYRKLKGQSPSAPQLTPEDLVAAGLRLMQSMRAIQALHIAGEPSERDNLDSSVQADYYRLKELLDDLHYKLSEVDTPEMRLDVARNQAEEFRQAVDLARGYCDAQHEALLNKLSRAYQKPDFCIRRNALAGWKDTLLPLSFSWDDNWYYGGQANFMPHQAYTAEPPPAATISV